MRSAKSASNALTALLAKQPDGSTVLSALMKGDKPGHAFRGNQYTGGKGGEDGGTDERSSSADPNAEVTHSANPRPGMGDIGIDPGTLKELQMSKTCAPFLDENGRLSPERQALHDEIVRKFLDGVPKSDDPTFTMMGGGPASGKSFFLKSGIVDKTDAAMIDADAIKKMLPEVQTALEAIKRGDPNANEGWAGDSHFESSYLAKRITAGAFERGVNAILDGTGDGGVDGVAKKIDMARDHGYGVDATYVTVTADRAISEAEKRAADPTSDSFGRKVPVDIITSTYKDLATTIPGVAEKFDNFRLYDNNLGKDAPGGKPPLVAEAHGPGTLQINDQGAWDRMRADANLRGPEREKG